MFAPELAIDPVTRSLTEGFVNNPSHGLLLVGEQGVGLYTIAIAIAASIYPTGVTLSIRPEDGKEIPIEQIRTLYGDTKSIHEQGQIVIIDDCDNMSLPAQNALLKLLEEPPRHTVFIMTSHKPGVLLSTITSRVSQVEVRRVSDLLSTEFINKYETNAQRRVQIGFLAQGRPAEIMRLVTDNEAFESRAAVVRDARTFLQASVYDRLVLINAYTKRDEAIGFVDMLGELSIFTQKRGETVPAIRYSSISAALDHLHENAHTKLQLIKLVSQL